MKACCICGDNFKLSLKRKFTCSKPCTRERKIRRQRELYKLNGGYAGMKKPARNNTFLEIGLNKS